MANFRNSLVFCLVSLYFASVHGNNLPPIIEVCHRRDTQENLTDCFKRNIDILRPKLLNGVKELLIPSFNPLTIPQVKLELGNRFAASFKNLELYGLENFVIEKLYFDPVNLKAELGMFLPKLRLKADYHLKGSLLILKLDGSGPADGNYTNVRGNITAHGEKYIKNGKTHVKMVRDNIVLNVGTAHLYFENIFGDNNELNNQTNTIINQNIDEIIVELLPIVTQILDEFVFGLANRIFDTYTYDELFPDP